MLNAVAFGFELALAVTLIGSAVLKSLKASRVEYSATVPAALVRRLTPDCRSCVAGSMWLIIAAEMLVGLLLLSTRDAYAPIASGSLFIAMSAVLEWSRRTAPQKPCGCMGHLSDASAGPSRKAPRPISFALVSAVCAFIAERPSWLHGYVSDGRAWIPGLFAFLAGAALVVTVSPELRFGRIEGFVRSVFRSRTASGDIRFIRGSYSWQTLSPHLVGDAPSDHWLDGDWRFVQWGARLNESQGSVIFAVLRTPRSTRVHGTFLEVASVDSVPKVLARVIG